jgi:hypothetical protein
MCRHGSRILVPSVLEFLGMGVSRLAWGKLPGPGSRWNSFIFVQGFNDMLLISFCCALDEKSEQGCGWHASVHQPPKHGMKQNTFILFNSN